VVPNVFGCKSCWKVEINVLIPWSDPPGEGGGGGVGRRGRTEKQNILVDE